MSNLQILHAVEAAWSNEMAKARTVLNLSGGAGHSSEMLATLGFRVVTTEYRLPATMSAGILRVGA